MTNTTYFHDTIRDDASTSSEETWRKPNSDQEEGAVANAKPSSSSSLYSVIGKAINTWISSRSVGGKPKDCSNDGEDLTYDPHSEGEKLEFSNLKIFDFRELKTATRNFHPDGILGEGDFGPVFKGWIDENTLTATKPGRGTAVAVKKLSLDGMQGHGEWLTEVKYLGQLHHINLVRLFGYCSVDKQRLLVYEFVHRGSLDNHIFRRGSSCLLSWSLRMKIALGAAKGLAFLHSAEINVIHRCFTSSNILLDSNYNAKLSDFGFARDGPTGDMSHVSTRVVGSNGYAAPEYVCTGHLTAKSDVYSFGIVLLEMLSGRRPIDHNLPSGERSLVEWAKPYLLNKRKIFRVLDHRLEGQYSLEGAHKAANLALRCIAVDPKFRPNMEEVVTILKQLQDSKDTQEEQN